MNKKKIISVGLALALTVGAVGCTKKAAVNEPNPKTTESNIPQEYTTNYTTGYNDYLYGLDKYNLYSNPGDINKIYENKEYPGNEAYLTDVKNAYKDSRDKIQGFVDTLKKETDIKDADLKKKNEELIAEGEKAIKDIDARLKNLEGVTSEYYTKSKEDFSKYVEETSTIKGNTENTFNKLVNDMNEMLGIKKK